MGFSGCISDLRVEMPDKGLMPVNLQKPKQADRSQNIKECGCKHNQCHNNGFCLERTTDFYCECQIGFTGPQCDVQGL